MKNSVRHTILVLYIVAMVLAFLVPVPRTAIPAPGGVDKVVHFGLFLGFALLYYLDRRPSVGWMLLVSFAFAGAIELVQWALPYRGSDWRDFIAGAVGAGAGTAVALLVTTR